MQTRAHFDFLGIEDTDSPADVVPDISTIGAESDFVILVRVLSINTIVVLPILGVYKPILRSKILKAGSD